MDTGLEYEGEAARQRFIVYWLRPGLAALGFGLFTFLVVSVPAEKEKIQLRDEVQRMRIESGALQTQLRELLPFARAARAEQPASVLLGRPGSADGWGRVLYDDADGRGVVFVENLDAADMRAFCWWRDADGKRVPLAAVPLDPHGAGHAQLQVPEGRKALGGFDITLEAPEGEPTGEAPAVLSGSLY